MPVQSKFTRSPYLECFRKDWPAIFQEDRKPPEEKSYVEDASGDHLLCFLQDYDEDVPFSEADEVMTFCREVHSSVLRRHDSGQRKAAWLDDRLWSYYKILGTPQTPAQNEANAASERPGRPRTRNTQLQATDTARSFSQDVTDHKITGISASNLPFREYEAPLSAAALFRYLKQKRFRHAVLPDADRRLIYISDLSPPFILALTETAPRHQVPALRDALFKHLALQTSMRVKISDRDYTVFQMDFHMPFCALRRGRPEEYFRDGVKPRRKWRDISFLANGMGIHEAQISFTICGPAESRWVAYAFVDTDFDEDKEMGADEFDYTSMLADQIASDGEVDANRPIFNPREYYLLIVSIRLKQVVKEWAGLVQIVEKGIEAHMDGPPSLHKATGSRPQEDEDTMATFDWTQKILETLSYLLGGFSKTNEAWKRFASDDGDIGYFSDLENVVNPSWKHMQRSLFDIKEKFEDLEGLQRRLERLEQRCQKSANILQLRLTLENNRMAKLNGFTSEIMISVISPPVVVSAVFAIPQPFGTFRRNGASFALAILVVFAVLQLLIMFRGRVPLWTHWSKLMATKGKLLPGGFNLCGRLSRLGRSSRSRSDIAPGESATLP
ncbi:hypothetical protein K469DRAFT_754507 [Zopfia rhizophila CBS 207.26]|uniref:Cora-domain-containing protein n=1 Tax=Zopfia rhizophila CBS 207.26 TaxID=1314779 RepID=A0A6A6DJ01_9PEZI|nr:hypothetical protein K469DRAFT_754507 [Zopfia rhizophila CBS 207.26]